MLFILFSAHIWYGAEPFLWWSITCVMVIAENNRLAPRRTISKFIPFLSTFCQVCAFVCFNLFCHSLWLLVPVSKGWCVCISADVLECYTPCVCNSIFLHWQRITSLQQDHSKLLSLQNSFLNFLTTYLQTKQDLSFYFVQKIFLSLTWGMFSSFLKALSLVPVRK